jgi:predicted nucleic acid-binding protein
MRSTMMDVPLSLNHLLERTGHIFAGNEIVSRPPRGLLRHPRRRRRDVHPASLREVCAVEALTLAAHERAMALACRHGMPVYDAMIAASAIEAGCTTLYSEDFRHRQVLKGLTIINPFR